MCCCNEKNPVGTVNYFARQFPPEGWLLCDGREVSRDVFADLFNMLGTSFGSGDGKTTFNLPDLRGEFIRGLDEGRGIDSDRKFGSWQKGTIYGYDTNNDGVWNITAVSEIGRTSQISIGVDNYNTSDYPDVKITGAGKQVPDELPGTAGIYSYSGITRPRNVALLACIKY